MFYCFSVCSELMYWVAVLFIRLCAKSRFEVLWVQNVLSYLGFIFGKLRLPCSIPVSYRVDFHCNQRKREEEEEEDQEEEEEEEEEEE